MRPWKKHPIEQLFDPAFVASYLALHAPLFAGEYTFSGLTATPIKRNIDVDFYHVVIRYDAPAFGDKPIFCSAHSNESRENAYRALRFITEHGFKTGALFVPEPLFFDRSLAAFLYRGIAGRTLLHYIRKGGDTIAEYIRGAAEWLAELHAIPTDAVENFNPESSRIKTVIPGPEYFLAKISRLFPEFRPDVEHHFAELAEREERALATLDRLCLIHGDFHPENVIVAERDGGVSGIDFTDICLADWARDVGNFLTQLTFMAAGWRTKDEVRSLQKTFLAHYAAARNVALDGAAWERIKLYQAWTSLRTVIYFLTKEPAEPREAKAAMEMVQHV
ncbi:MAG: aminoglycoside phosphotransferase family protein [Parcubacteria group bacterium]|nr:aminoglycoside phosphotransferase family protein [Parcubacteria group bacterium]